MNRLGLVIGSLFVAFAVVGCNSKREEEKAKQPPMSEEDKVVMEEWQKVVAAVTSDMEAYNKTSTGAYQVHYNVVGNRVKKINTPGYPFIGYIEYEELNNGGGKFHKDPGSAPMDTELRWDNAAGKWKMGSDTSHINPISAALFRSVIGR